MTLAYRYQRDPAVDAQYQLQGREQVSFAGQWPLSKRWYGVGRIDYSMLDSRVTQSIAGLEYKGDCCWAARAVFQRYAVAANDTNTTFFLQLELTGLGSLGTDPLGLLSRSIPGYESVNPSVPQGTRFDRYE
jgi:LPS-assembly protein